MGTSRWAAVVAALALAASGCGGSDEGSGPEGGGESAGAPVKGKKGGEVTFLAAADVDYIDPGQTYYTFGYTVQYAVNRPLYSFEPDDADTPVPDLAEGEPEISDDNKTITVKLRSGVRFSPPVDREVTSADVEYAMERAFTANVPSGYALSYFGDVEGAPDEPGDFRDTQGSPPDDRTLVFELDKPTAVTVAAALVMPISVPVPRSTPSPSTPRARPTYDQYVAFTGPYMVRNDADGKLVGRDPGKSIEIIRNPNWDPATDYRPAYLDAITHRGGQRRPHGGEPPHAPGPGADVLRLGPAADLDPAPGADQDKDQLGRVASGGTRWIALNTRRSPFDNANVRKAVIAAFDREALLLTRGGREVGPIAQHYIPPGVPGFEESGGEQGFNDIDFMANPKGDPELARKYMLAAKDEGVPVTDDGRYAGGEKLLTIATNADPGLQTATVAQGQLRSWASSSTSARSRRTRSTRGSATCRARTTSSARTSAGSATSRTRSRCSSRRSRARRSSRRAT